MNLFQLIRVQDGFNVAQEWKLQENLKHCKNHKEDILLL